MRKLFAGVWLSMDGLREKWWLEENEAQVWGVLKVGDIWPACILMEMI